METLILLYASLLTAEAEAEAAYAANDLQAMGLAAGAYHNAAAQIAALTGTDPRPTH